MRYLAPAALFSLLVWFLYVGLSIDPTKLPSALLDKPAPQFSLPRLDDSSRTADSTVMHGKVALLNVWATWCVACRDEHDALLAIRRSGVVPVYGLNWKDERGKALEWLGTLGNPYELTFFDATGDVVLDFGVTAAPETFVIDAGGIIRHKHVGPITAQVWQDTLLPLIRSLETS